jgi:hypothetical protein
VLCNTQHPPGEEATNQGQRYASTQTSNSGGGHLYQNKVCLLIDDTMPSICNKSGHNDVEVLLPVLKENTVMQKYSAQ